MIPSARLSSPSSSSMEKASLSMDCNGVLCRGSLGFLRGRGFGARIRLHMVAWGPGLLLLVSPFSVTPKGETPFGESGSNPQTHLILYLSKDLAAITS